MRFACRGQEYHFIVGSDVERDGMYLEITEVTESGFEVLEIFYSDQTDEMTITVYVWDVPVEVVEWALLKAREWLTPTVRR